MEYWTHKYTPKKATDVIGQFENLKKMYIFVSQFPRVRKRAILMHGGSGVGKTSGAYALANELNLELVELNASDLRNEQAVIAVLGSAAKQASLFGNKKLILVDEIDGMYGVKDRGGVGAVIDVIKESKYPIIITANNAFQSKLKTLRKYCDLIEFKPIPDMMIISRLKQICEAEGIAYDEAALRKLAGSADGDLRSAINDLQIMSEGRSKLTLEDIKLWGREREENIMNLLKLVYKSFDADLVLTTSNYVSDDISNLLLWLDENLENEYSKKDEISYAYNMLAEADRFLARIRLRQHWRFLIYARILSLVGVQQAKNTPNPKFVSYKYPGVLLSIFQRAAKRKKMQVISELATQKLHSSVDRLTKDFWPYFDFIQQRNPEYAEGLLEYIEPVD